MTTRPVPTAPISLTLLALLTAAGAAAPPAVGAAGGLTPLTVSSCTDSAATTPGGAPGELRRLIRDAAANALIVIPPDCVITLTGAGNEDASDTGDLDVLVSLTIQGAGPGKSVLDGGAVDRVFHVIGSVTVAISGVTIRNGDVTGRGGGVLVDTGATLALRNAEVTGNIARATNASQEGGGGVANQGGTLVLQEVTLHDNATTVGTGGGLRNAGDGTSTLANVTISGNRADSTGGGLAAISGPVALNNVTITLNDADHDGSNPGGGNGGGLRVVDNATTNVTLRNTIIAGNTQGSGAAPNDCSVGPLAVGQFTSLGSNLVRVATGCAGLQPLDGPPGAQTGDVTGQNPNLGPLALNGGRTRTHALLDGSPALDRGDGACEATDQRGVNRPQNGRCDIGAFERGTSSVATLALADFDGDGHADLIAGQGSGGHGEIRVLSGATGGLLLGLLPFGSAYRGPLALTGCDLNGDGTPDVVAGGGSVLGPEIRVFDGRTGVQLPAPLGSFPAFAAAPPGARTAVRGPVSVGCADVNGDGVPDLIAGAPAGAAEGPLVRVFSGRDGSLLSEDLAFDASVRGGVAVGP